MWSCKERLKAAFMLFAFPKKALYAAQEPGGNHRKLVVLPRPGHSCSRPIVRAGSPGRSKFHQEVLAYIRRGVAPLGNSCARPRQCVLTRAASVSAFFAKYH